MPFGIILITPSIHLIDDSTPSGEKSFIFSRNFAFSPVICSGESTCPFPAETLDSLVARGGLGISQNTVLIISPEFLSHSGVHSVALRSVISFSYRPFPRERGPEKLVTKVPPGCSRYSFGYFTPLCLRASQSCVVFPKVNTSPTSVMSFPIVICVSTATCSYSLLAASSFVARIFSSVFVSSLSLNGSLTPDIRPNRPIIMVLFHPLSRRAFLSSSKLENL